MKTLNTLADALAARRSSKRAMHFIEGSDNERSLPLGELYARATGFLHHLQLRGAHPGSEMILLLQRNDQFIDAFWACMLGKVIAVPLAPGNTDGQRLKFFRVLQRLERPHLCTDTPSFARLSAFATANGLDAEIDRIRPATLFVDEIEDIERPGIAHLPAPDDIAFVQYSSGSTSEPKGVALTHRNLVANIKGIAERIDLTPDDYGLSWMPLTHDMGLIGFHLTLVFGDCAHGLMPTSLFVRNPQLWLVKASEKRASLLCSPNFGYRHFLKSFNRAQAQSVNLSHVRLLFNGAEPISVELCSEFLSALAPSGLARKSMFPVYGLAEASLAVTLPEPGSGCTSLRVNRNALGVGDPVELLTEDVAHALSLAQVGERVPGCQLRITDDADSPVAEGVVGHIHIRGENVMRGYYHNPSATDAVMRGDGWLDTGDLGFLSQKQLTVTGRFKEILFVNGQNYYPNDIEAVIEKKAGIEAGKAAVSGARANSFDADEVLAFILHRGNLEEFAPTAKSIKRTVNEAIGIAVDHVIPVAKIPKTTSGKIQRYALGAAYGRGEFNQILAALEELNVAVHVGKSDARTEIEKELKQICEGFISGKALSVDDNIFELGTSSLTLAQIYQRIELLYPGRIAVTDFFDYPTIAQLAKYLEGRLNSAQA